MENYRRFFYYTIFRERCQVVAVGDSNWNIYLVLDGFRKGRLASIPKPGNSALNGCALPSSWGDVRSFGRMMVDNPRVYRLTPFGKELLFGRKEI